MDSVLKPKAYIIPFAWSGLCNLLEYRGVKCNRIQNDSLLTVEADYITDYITTTKAYEGHYLHSNVKTRSVTIQKLFHQGDVIIYTGTRSDRYIVNALEAKALDSFFCWGYFDSILQQKEHFSDYVFEDTASKLLIDNKLLREEFEQKYREDSIFAGNRRLQLDFIYKKSKYYENTAYLYPVMRIR